MGIFDIFRKAITEIDNLPSDDNKSIKGLIHHVLDWSFTQGWETKKMSDELEDKHNQAIEDLSNLRDKFTELEEEISNLKEVKKKKKK